MSIPYERRHERQKARTRTALVAATRPLLAEGVTPTVERAAERAEISRTTAYRYFPNQRALLTRRTPNSRQRPCSRRRPRRTLASGWSRHREHRRQTLDFEPELPPSSAWRSNTRPGPDALPLRSGRGIGWIEDASPLARADARLGAGGSSWPSGPRSGSKRSSGSPNRGGPPRTAVDIMRSSARAILRPPSPTPRARVPTDNADDGSRRECCFARRAAVRALTVVCPLGFESCRGRWRLRGSRRGLRVACSAKARGDLAGAQLTVEGEVQGGGAAGQGDRHHGRVGDHVTGSLPASASTRATSSSPSHDGASMSRPKSASVVWPGTTWWATISSNDSITSSAPWSSSSCPSSCSSPTWR